MPLDTRIPLSIQQPQFQSPLNTLARVQQVRAQQQAMQMNALRMQRSEEEYQRQQQIRNALAGGDGSLDSAKRVAIQTGDAALLRTVLAAEASATSTQVNQQKHDAGRLKIQRDKLAQVGDQASYDAFIAENPGFAMQHGTKYSPEVVLSGVQNADSFLKQNVITAADQAKIGQGNQRLTEQSRHDKAMEDKPTSTTQTLDDRLALKGLKQNPDGTQTFIPGGPADPDVMRRNQSVKLSEGDKANREKHYPKATAAMTASTRDLDTLIAKVDELAAHPGLPNITGTLAGRTPNVTNEATGAQAVLDSIRAAGALAKITELRQNSPTGGALGNVSDRDIVLLKDAAATLAQSQGTPAFKQHLADYRALLERTKQDITEAYSLDYEYRQSGGSAAPGGSGAPAAPSGTPSVDDLVNKYAD